MLARGSIAAFLAFIASSGALAAQQGALQSLELRSRLIVDTASDVHKTLHDLLVTLTLPASAVEDLVGATVELPGLRIERFGFDEAFDEEARGYSGGAWLEAAEADPEGTVLWRIRVARAESIPLAGGELQVELFGEVLAQRVAIALSDGSISAPSPIEVVAPYAGESVTRDTPIVIAAEPIEGELLCLETPSGPQRDLAASDIEVTAGQRAFAIPVEVHGPVRLLSIRHNEVTSTIDGIRLTRRVETIRAHWFTVAADPFEALLERPRALGIAQLDYSDVDPLGTAFWAHAAVPCGEGFVHVLSMWGGSFEALHRVKEVTAFCLRDVPGADARLDKTALRRAIGADGLCFIIGPRDELNDAIALVEEFGQAGWGIPSDIVGVDGDPATLSEWGYDGVLDEVTSALIAFAELDELPLVKVLEEAVTAARNAGVFRPAEQLLERGSLARFYTATLAEIGFGLWEGNRGADGSSVDGMFSYADRLGLESQDLVGWQVFKDLYGSTLDVLALIHPDFEGRFYMARRSDLPYTARSQYLVRAQLRGSRSSGLVGNDLDNVLGGNQGDNVLIGAGGFDIVTFEGLRSEYQIELLPGAARVSDTVQGRDGRDLCLGIELLRFRDTDLPVPDP